MEKKNTKTILQWISWIIGIVMGVILIFVLLKECKRTSTEAEQISLINALQDSLKLSRAENGSQTATIEVLKTEQVETFTELNTKNREIANLQDEVERYKDKLHAGSSVSTGVITTKIDATTPTTVTHDPIKGEDNVVYGMETYGTDIHNEWIDYHMRAGTDSTTTSIKIKNSFTVAIGYDKKKPFADLHTNNPYSNVDSFRVYQVSMPKPKRWGIGPNVGVGIGSGFKLSPMFGIGIQYNIIRF